MYKLGAHLKKSGDNKLESSHQGRKSMAYNDFGEPSVHSQSPSVTGTAIIGCCFDGGVVMVSDAVLAYGRYHRYFNMPRVFEVNERTALSISGDYADAQFIMQHINNMRIADQCYGDGQRWSPKSLHSWLTRVLYNFRSKFDPRWNTFLVAGVEEGESYLGSVDLLGVGFTNRFVATGFGRFIATPFLEKVYRDKNFQLTEEDALKAAMQCLRLLYYRQTESHSKYQVAVVKKDGVHIGPILEMDSDWSIAPTIRGYE